MMMWFFSACAQTNFPDKGTNISMMQVGFEKLPGWSLGSQEKSLEAWKYSCDRILQMEPEKTLSVNLMVGKAGEWFHVCTKIKDLPKESETVREFVESNFFPYAIFNGDNNQGLFTGYFEPIVKASEFSNNQYRFPIYGIPRDHISINLQDFDPKLPDTNIVGRLKKRRLVPYYTRSEIRKMDSSTLPILYWADDLLGVYIMQVQGSGVIQLTDGKRQRIGFAGHNGHDYVSVGQILINRNQIKSGKASWKGIRKWMERQKDLGRSLLDLNPRYIFFEKTHEIGPRGSAGVPLTPKHSIAVDSKFIPMHIPLWIDTKYPGKKNKRFQHLVLAQDVGNAIRGPVRGDIFWGTGSRAFQLAGKMKSSGVYFVLIPANIRVSN